MSKLLRFEFHKLFRQKSFYICTALLLVINLYTIIYAYDNGGIIATPQIDIDIHKALIGFVINSRCLLNRFYDAVRHIYRPFHL